MPAATTETINYRKGCLAVRGPNVRLAVRGTLNPRIRGSGPRRGQIGCEFEPGAYEIAQKAVVRPRIRGSGSRQGFINYNSNSRSKT